MIYIIAEIGPNHSGSLDKAIELVDASKKAGADAVKFQFHIPQYESTKDAPPPPYFNKEKPYEFFERTEFQIQGWFSLRKHVKELGLAFICSPFSIEAADILELMDIDAYKIASGEVTNIPMLEHIAKLGKPVYLSTGMSSYVEIVDALGALGGWRDFTSLDITLMQCSSLYPCPYDKVGLNVIKDLKKYGLPVGLSDHTKTIYAPIVAVTQGATVIEKHITLTHNMIGPDASFSLTPDKFKEMVDGIRATDIMMDSAVDKDDLSIYKDMKYIFQKSVTSTQDITRGTTVNESMISLKKPGDGIQPKDFESVIGKVAVKDIAKDKTIYERDLE